MSAEGFAGMARADQKQGSSRTKRTLAAVTCITVRMVQVTTRVIIPAITVRTAAKAMGAEELEMGAGVGTAVEVAEVGVETAAVGAATSA